ncbi:hypothetical protein [Streptomyces sp. NPDC048650]|uniref:hypothetical protein n=1 Tax=Streptomyces sp. NPDC048650 TaxID=3365583 RepID=UPI00371028DA
MKSKRAFLTIATASLFTSSGVLTGCSAPSMGVNEAVRKIDAKLAGTFASVGPPLKKSDGPARITEGANSFTNEPNGEGVVARTGYVRTKVSKARVVVLAKAVEKHWKAKGYELENASRKVPTFEYSTPEGVSLTFDVNGDLITIGATVSDVEYPGHGDIDDGDFPNGLGDVGPTPNVRDPYWSK